MDPTQVQQRYNGASHSNHQLGLPASPTGSLLRGWRPSLAVLFHQFLSRGNSSEGEEEEERDYLLKEDFSEVFPDANQLDKAFEELDADKDGRITLDEFMAGFATFLRQAQMSSSLNPDSLEPATEELLKRGGSSRRSVRRRPIPEIFFETVEGDGTGGGGSGESNGVQKPTDSFKTSLKPLATRTQESIEQLWIRLNNSNPELVTDFEEFICDMSTEVESAQNALKRQREANTKEAYQLDEEMVRIQHDTLTALEQETALLREKAHSSQSKLEVQLYEKERELTEIKGKLELLENKITESNNRHNELKEMYQNTFDEKDELHERLSQSESLLKKSQEEIDAMKKENNEKLKDLLEEKEKKEESLQQIESKYLKEIKELKDVLSNVVQQQEIQQQKQVQLQTKLLVESSGTGSQVQRPDLLTAAHYDILGRDSPSPSLHDEIVATEGNTSPVLRDTMLRLRPPTLIVPPPVSGLGVVGSGVNFKELDHLDLATTPTQQQSANQMQLDTGGVRLRSKTSLQVERGAMPRPVSLMGTRGGASNNNSLDLNWPPSNWTVAPQDWLASVAAGNITRSPSPPDTELLPPPPPQPSPSDNGRGSRLRKSYSNPDMCQPLQFLDKMVVQPDITFKILIVGNPHVGKSCFLTRLCTNTFTTKYASTIGVDFYSRALVIDDKTVALQFWDTAGQERFQSVTKAYYRGADGVILMYDITSEETFIAVRKWINSMQDNMDKLPACLLLVGNKVDLEHNEKREVLSETGETFAKIYGAHFIETSAKLGFNVTNACLTLVNKLLSEVILSGDSRQGNTITVGEKEKKSNCSC
ncbi:PREDICTED: ras and EF-hand domain-containing protein-like isoform X2 [Amphimedon queenslandica]|uniref:EF-hand domain-containing protein n=1 Tax=Amphimedon queenslandica TaxID=400682 RepID=A0A1X7VV72_AMPQE|nr:PREDICTED: ras and EF-hand domain-containing protein-like isoform X2 [Amphimedon queenslandica]|eukprot:XP_019848798.1 PREDICTED: ras and EF-hand domain-containing protein-like isoform X2 [Amphimedon queenslandica]